MSNLSYKIQPQISIDRWKMVPHFGLLSLAFPDARSQMTVSIVYGFFSYMQFVTQEVVYQGELQKTEIHAKKV